MQNMIYKVMLSFACNHVPPNNAGNQNISSVFMVNLFR